MPSLANRALASRATPVVAALTGALAAFSPSPAAAGDEATSATSITFRVMEPPVLSFESTALGRATHPVRVVVTNTGARTVQLDPLAFRVRPVRDGVAFTCDEPRGEEARWPATLEPGASFTISKQVSCETPLPGRYDMELRGRPRGGPDSAERTYGTFAVQIDPGANPPVRLPWEGSLHAAASGTKDMRPTTDPNKARIVVAMINGTKKPLTLAPLRATMRVSRRGSTVAPCAEHSAELAFNGPLAPGQTVSLAAPLRCQLSAEAVYDVDVALTNASGNRVHVATHTIRVGVIPPPPPRPEQGQQPGKLLGGM